LVGKGFTSEIYALGKKRVLKLFHPWIAESTVEREFRTTRAIHAAGLPAPATHEKIHIEGRNGIIFEHIDGPSMLTQVQARPWTLFRAVRQLAESRRPRTCPSRRRARPNGAWPACRTARRFATGIFIPRTFCSADAGRSSLTGDQPLAEIRLATWLPRVA
jgi:hypothetical protein